MIITKIAKHVRRIVKRQPNLGLLFAVIGSCVTLGITSALRAALFHPDVSWDKKGNPEPWEKYRNKRYKFFSSKGENLTRCDAPDY